MTTRKAGGNETQKREATRKKDVTGRLKKVERGPRKKKKQRERKQKQKRRGGTDGTMKK
jgi:hypothetical protein